MDYLNLIILLSSMMDVSTLLAVIYALCFVAAFITSWTYITDVPLDAYDEEQARIARRLRFVAGFCSIFFALVGPITLLSFIFPPRGGREL